MPAPKSRRHRPPMVLMDPEAALLGELALQMEDRAPQVSAPLLGEIECARTCVRDRLPPDVVIMRLRVAFTDDGTGARHRVGLVFPRDADAEAGGISIRARIGAGLIGTRVGQSISWPNRSGEHRVRKILAVAQPAVSPQ